MGAGEHVLGRLARGLVDHLVAVRQRPAAVVRRARERVHDRLRPRNLVGVRAEDLVDDLDLVGVQRPLAVAADRAGAQRRLAQPFQVADRGIGPVDSSEAVRVR